MTQQNYVTHGTRMLNAVSLLLTSSAADIKRRERRGLGKNDKK